MNSYDVIGIRMPRHDVVQQVTGKVVYGEDLYRPDMLYAKALYSKYAHAKILRVDVSEASRVPGVKGIITAEDVPNNRFGFSHIDQPVLADDKVRYRGDAVAVVAADSLKAADEAVKLIKVDYDVLPVVFDPLEAMKEDAPLVHDGSNIVTHIKIRQGDAEEGFKNSDIIVEEEFSSQKVEHSPIETHVALAEIENDGKLVIWTSSSRPFHYAEQLIKILAIPMNRLQIKTPSVGGAFGGKNEITLEPWVALLAMKTKRPVKMVFTREEEFFSSTVRHPYIMKYKTGLRKDGKIIARQVQLISNSGAYAALGKSTLTKATVHCCGPYNIPNVKVDGYLVYTNTLVGGSMRGMGVPQVCFAHEVHANTIAEKLGMDPVEFRIKNMFGETGTLPNGQEVNAKPLQLTLQKALKLYESSLAGGADHEKKR
ncbi:MAG: molybdopterin-dependent oxidoreductase [Bacillota bacterium]|nr:molybdopterin-dependent oxidoreductase [Bacillota bacterium]